MHSVIRRHEGLIQVESDDQHGAPFHIYLPATSELPVAEKLPAEEAEEQHKVEGSILIMDDEEMILEVAAEMLSSIGYKATPARNGEEAIELYKKAKDTSQPFDLVLLDLTVRGGLGGKDTIKRLLKIDPFIRGIVTSGYHEDPVMSDPLSLGFRASIVKPLGRLSSVRW